MIDVVDSGATDAQGPQLRDQAFSYEAHSATIWAEEPLVASDGVKVAVDLSHVHRELAGGLRAVKHNQRAPVVGQIADLTSGDVNPALVGGIGEPYQSRLWREEVRKAAQELLPIISQAHLLDNHAIVSGQAIEGHVEDLLIAGDDLIASLPRKAIGDDVEGFCHSTGECELLGVRAEKLGGPLPGRGHEGLRLLAEDGRGRSMFAPLAEEALDLLRNRPGSYPDACRVQIGVVPQRGKVGSQSGKRCVHRLLHRLLRSGTVLDEYIVPSQSNPWRGVYG